MYFANVTQRQRKALYLKLELHDHTSY